MNADQRLDQLELLMSESMAILDQRTALLNRHTAPLKQLVGTALQHSDGSSYVPCEVMQIKENQVGLASQMGGLENQMGGLKGEVKKVDGKLDQILGLLSNGK